MENRYTVSVSFTTNQKLDTEQIEAICTQIAAQVEEPVTIYGDEVEYETELVAIQVKEVIL